MTSRRLSLAYTTSLSEGELNEIQVEVMIRNGLQRFDIIGLPQHMIREGRDRILSALAHLGIELPAQKILVSLTPGSIRKEGTHFDLPILYGILKGLGVIPNRDERTYLWGELSLRGDVRPFAEAAIHWLFAAKRADLIISAASEKTQAPLLKFLRCPVRQTKTVADILKTDDIVNPQTALTSDEINQRIWNDWLSEGAPLWDGIRGSYDQFLFWTLVILGRHSLLIEGPPGVGKSSWVKAATQIQSPLPIDDWAYVSASDFSALGRRPFLSPHHSSSMAAIVGGGSQSALPGAITRAHQGILFLDELREFSRDVLESLREPLELKQITVSRSQAERTFQADTQILAAMNLCPCGRAGSKDQCTCTTRQYHSYRGRISGPIRDRFDFSVEWKFFNSVIPDEFRSESLKPRLAKVMQRSPPRAELIGDACCEVKVPNPRRRSSFHRIFGTWCRWYEIDDPKPSDAKNCEKFIRSFTEEAAK